MWVGASASVHTGLRGSTTRPRGRLVLPLLASPIHRPFRFQRPPRVPGTIGSLLKPTLLHLFSYVEIGYVVVAFGGTNAVAPVW